MTSPTIYINRAPVLALWAAIVARRLGFREEEALSLGKAVAGLNAQSKGRRLGIYKPSEAQPARIRKSGRDDPFLVEVCGRAVPAVTTSAGVRATAGGKAVSPEAAQRYLIGKFGESLPAARVALKRLATAYRPKELIKSAYALYERFRPVIPAGLKGWGTVGVLDLRLIERLARERSKASAKSATGSAGNRRRAHAPATEKSGTRVKRP